MMPIGKFLFGFLLKDFVDLILILFLLIVEIMRDIFLLLW